VVGVQTIPATVGPRTPRRPAGATIRSVGRRHVRLVVVTAVGVAYFAALAVALRLEWYPQALPGWLYLGVVALVGAATVERWPVETLVNVTAFTAFTTLAPLPPALYGMYVGPPWGLVPLAVLTFLTISGRGPVVAPAATLSMLVLLVVLPWRDVAAAGADGVPLYEALVLDRGQDRSVQVGQLVAGGLVVLVALLLRRQREATAELAARNRELVELRAGEVARIAERERSRIARDVHDEVAHHVAALVIRAQAALRVADQHPDQLAPAMRDIAEGGQDVLGRIRRVVRMLKTAPSSAGAPPETLEDELGTMLGRLRSIGYAVEATVPAGVDLPASHRAAVVGVVQESLTNVMLHSSAHSVRVAVEGGATTWTVEVTDPGPARERFPDVPRGGTGIPSMTERVLALGGRLSSGSDPGAGWAVRAELPREAAPAAAPARRRVAA
jgi:signal transduction histidine kinase